MICTSATFVWLLSPFSTYCTSRPRQNQLHEIVSCVRAGGGRGGGGGLVGRKGEATNKASVSLYLMLAICFIYWQPMYDFIYWQRMFDFIYWQPMYDSMYWQPMYDFVYWQRMYDFTYWQPMYDCTLRWVYVVDSLMKMIVVLEPGMGGGGGWQGGLQNNARSQMG